MRDSAQLHTFDDVMVDIFGPAPYRVCVSVRVYVVGNQLTTSHELRCFTLVYQAFTEKFINKENFQCSYYHSILQSEIL